MRSIFCKGRRMLDREALVAFSAFARSNSVPVMAISVLADITINHGHLIAAAKSCDI